MNILLLAGGESSEREVSLDSSASIYRALIESGHGVRVADPFTGDELRFDGQRLSGTTDPVPADAPAVSPDFVQRLFDGTYDSVDVAFLGLHGGCGEDGTIQSLLDLADLPYTGSGPTASALAMDKAIAKQLMLSIDVPTPAFRRLTADECNQPQVAADLFGAFDFPFIIKPNKGGSTVGLTKVREASGIRKALESACEDGGDVLVEQFVPGREMTVAVLNFEALPVVEIIPKNELYDYEAKYTKGKSEYVAPAKIDDELATRLQEAAVRVYRAFGCSGLARVDFILTENGDYPCLEINTLPGMTELSLSPMAAKVTGTDFRRLVQKIIDSAIGRSRG
jgi:D-alanine-D-alanine ligase